MEDLELYVVRNQGGKYFRSKGYGGYGSNWVDELQKARIYAKIGPARSQVSFWATNYPKYGTPVIVVLTVAATKVLQEDDRVKKAAIKRQKEKISNELYWANQKLKEAESRVRHLADQKAFLSAKNNVEKLQSELKSL
jgi:hypothetical protein